MRRKICMGGLRGMSVVVLLGIGILNCSGAAGELEPEPASAFQEANRLYEQGEYDAAILAYDRLLEDGRGSAAVHFNLGNAWFRAGEVGRAIWQYRIAQEMRPRDADIGANLQFARSTVGGLDREGRLSRGLGYLTVNEWALLSVTLFWIWMGGLILGKVRAGLWPVLRLWVRLAVVAWLSSVVALSISSYGRFGRKTAIVVTEGLVRYGPFEESQPHFTVQDGAELEIMDTRDGWVHVEDAQRGGGWIPRSFVLVYPDNVEETERL